MEVTIYVPHADSPVELGIIDGSAIVGSPLNPWLRSRADLAMKRNGIHVAAPQHDDDRLVIDFEGDRFGHMPHFTDKLLHAAGRHVEHYPTVARLHVEASTVLAVGTYNTETRAIQIWNSEALESWIGQDALDECYGTAA